MGRKRSTKRKAPSNDYAEPTPEQLATGAFHRELVTYRRTPVIDTLFQEHKLTQRQYDGLARYRTIAVNADRSELRSCIDFSVRGNGEGLPHFGVRMNIELDRLEAKLLGKRKPVTEKTLVLATDNELLAGRLERELRNLLPIARAVAVGDVTLSQWAVGQWGGSERQRGAVVSIEPSRKALDRALVDIRMAGEWLAAEIGA